ncbi:DUF1552 domain-containing protein [Sandaracinus amylolyticus]|uniref:Tat (Twin-arginine translocation) pathway signal sequence domain protein n=1 Tax=Sandaracinus amylolyticus TaxID=927083 RepID=A0A0F6W7Y2_9BACT|nr:DUF1552 domain-containing protein [Sandaracinus amylolyticus]AKF09705.1 hypothetical protein DB32_006854 [Sandaracinus amylolyticus]
MRLSRRAMLRGALGGAVCTMGLPLLDAMLDGHGTAHADGTALPKRFAVFFWANGLPWHGAHGHGRPDHWTPSTIGAGWSATPLLSPLAGLEPSIDVITGLEPHTEIPSDPPGQGDGHMRGCAVALTSDRPRSEGFHHPDHVFAFQRATLDQVIAAHPDFAGRSILGTQPRFRSIELAVSGARFHDYGHWNAISHRGPDMLNLPMRSARELFAHLFGVPADTAVLGRRASVLDVVAEDARALRRRLGGRDRERLDAHLEHVGEIQTRLRAGVAACTTPAMPGESGGDLIAETEAQTRLLALAMSCDLTRVASMMLTSPATTHVFRDVGVAGGMHQVVHDGDWDAAYRVTQRQMQALRVFLDVLASVPDHDGGTLLDSMVVYATSEYGEGTTHSNREHPVILAGGARGALARGIHAREPGGNLAKVHVTILRALGIETPSYGFHGAETSDAIPGLLV